MRTTLLGVLLLGFLTQLTATEQIIKVTPRTLGSWNIAGADKNSVAQQSALSLPAGAQLERVFTESAVVLHLVTRPVLSDLPASWPIVEVGPVSLAFTKDGTNAKLMLVLNNDTQVTLPGSESPTAEQQAFDVTLGYDPVAGTAIVGIGNQSEAYDVPASTTPVEVILTAGESGGWPQDSMEVLLMSNDLSGTTNQTSNGRSVAKVDPVERLKTGAAKLTQGAANIPQAVETAPTESTITSASSAPPTLEIFTPPVVRKGRSEAIRAAVALAKKS